MSSIVLTVALLVAQAASSRRPLTEDVRREQVMQWMVKADAASCQSLDGALTDPVADIRQRAASALYVKCNRYEAGRRAAKALCRSVELGNANAGAILLLGYAPRDQAESCLKRPQPKGAMVKIATSTRPVPSAFAAQVPLARLGDAQALTHLRNAFEKPSVDEALFLLAVLTDIEDQQALQSAAALLDDKRECPGVNSDLTRTVRDVALEALVQRLSLKPSFPIEYGRRYTDSEIAEIRKSVQTAP